MGVRPIHLGPPAEGVSSRRKPRGVVCCAKGPCQALFFWFLFFARAKKRDSPKGEKERPVWWQPQPSTESTRKPHRRERDSNPRDPFESTRFPGVRLKPLGHLSFVAGPALAQSQSPGNPPYGFLTSNSPTVTTSPWLCKRKVTDCSFWWAVPKSVKKFICRLVAPETVCWRWP